MNDVCMAFCNDSRACKYLAVDENNYSSFFCVKKVKQEKETIDKRISDYLADCKAKGVDPKAKNVPLGDNCGGYIILKKIQQGYDVDSK